MIVKIPTLTIKAKMRCCFLMLGAMFVCIATLAIVASSRTPDQSGQLNMLLTILAGLGVMLTALCGRGLYRAVLIPLDRAIVQLGAISKGNLAEVTATVGGPKLARLEKELSTLRESTKVLVVGMTQAASTVGEVAKEIARESQQLAVRTNTQLDFLQQTSQSFDQITSTIAQSADNANNAQTKVNAASEAALEGLAAITDVAKTMTAIEQSSQEIVTIVSLIDSIAFQTNILALNAAVESARAGEQGKGFSVVASEVRTLAQRSANAAREVKILIEKSAANVSNGNRLVNNAAERMNRIVRSIGDGAAIMSEIAAASSEQSTGLEQAKMAMYKIDEMAHQNAARVEKNANTSLLMNSQVESLLTIVAPFRIQ
ncbi:methyl-accepting chemotaxis protein [Herbaspirillum rhizosphaerae]|uniref:Methyl-accepting chemotaxis protein n=1 Tax=Herbaspirillum rhizosphaerae TaxID=346179 RepID=A0ABW8Z9I8_9BURK